MKPYGKPPKPVGTFNIDLREVMHYLYLPVRMPGTLTRLPPNVEVCRQMILAAISTAGEQYDYCYLSARKGWASPDNPLNRPGWHCDGFGTDDLNFIWWSGPGTRFALHPFHDISDDHVVSLHQFEEQVDLSRVMTPIQHELYRIDPYVVHATPLIEVGCMRQFVKISLSNHRYNLENNSHNYLFNYDWPMQPREMIRNDPHKEGG